MNFPPIIQHPSGDAMMPRKVVDGLIDMASVNPGQERMIDGLIRNPSEGSEKAMERPIRAEGSYVGAPTIMAGHMPKAYAPKTKTKLGVRMPVGQN